MVNLHVLQRIMVSTHYTIYKFYCGVLVRMHTLVLSALHVTNDCPVLDFTGITYHNACMTLATRMNVSDMLFPFCSLYPD
jgi:hypothetical protein